MNAPGASDNLEDWLDWLGSTSPNEIDLGLERVSAVLERLALVQPSRRIVVAGTNGKGSTVALLEALYRQRKGAVGAFISPHLVRYNERIRLDGTEAAGEVTTDLRPQQDEFLAKFVRNLPQRLTRQAPQIGWVANFVKKTVGCRQDRCA